MSVLLKHSPVDWMRRLIGALLCLVAFGAGAHEPSKSYLNLTLNRGVWLGQWQVPLRDLAKVVAVRTANDPPLSRPEVQSHTADMAAYAFSHLSISCDGQKMALRPKAGLAPVERLSDGDYLHLDFTLEGAAHPQTIQVNYTLFFETNSLHRGLARIEAGGKIRVAAFSPGRPTQVFQLDVPASWPQFLAFAREGVWHIWTGYDHILFLLALLLPSVLIREGGKWREVGALRPAFLNVLKIVTAFTIAHSLTLTLDTLGWVELPSRLTESAIAVTVALAAANNLWPLTRERGWIVAFAFGLIHGFGFANALSDLGLSHGGLALTLVGFNLGVELGQLAIVAAFLPAAFALRRTWLYKT